MTLPENIAPVHVGIIGAGMISGAYLDALTTRFSIIQVDAVGVRTPSKGKWVTEKFGIPVCTIEELLANETIELIVNLTPPDAHAEILERCLLAGKHVYTEKCFTLNTEDAKRICALAEEKGLQVGSSPDTYFSGWQQTARQVIDSGRLGTITSFAMVGNRDNERLLSAMAYLSKPGGGIILDYAIYYLTALVNLLGPVKKVSTTIRAPYPTHVNQFELSPHYGEVFETPNESQFYSVLELENGIMGTFAINADSVFFDQTYFAIYGNKGIMYLGCPDWFNGEISIYENTYDFSKAACPERVKVEIPFGYNRDTRGVGAADMAWAIRTGREARCSKERTYHILDVQETMLKSHECQGAFVEVASTCQRSKPLSVPTDGEESSLI